MACAASRRCCCVNGTTASGVLTIQTDAGAENVDAARRVDGRAADCFARPWAARRRSQADDRRRRRDGRRSWC